MATPWRRTRRPSASTTLGRQMPSALGRAGTWWAPVKSALRPDCCRPELATGANSGTWCRFYTKKGTCSTRNVTLARGSNVRRILWGEPRRERAPPLELPAEGVPPQDVVVDHERKDRHKLGAPSPEGTQGVLGAKSHRRRRMHLAFSYD